MSQFMIPYLNPKEEKKWELEIPVFRQDSL